MTHEELLAKISEIATVKFSEIELESTWTRLCKLPEALRAVVELHKPIPYMDGIACDADINSAFYHYPCPTIQAIQEHLK